MKSIQIAFFILCAFSVALAQDAECVDAVQAAIESTLAACRDVGANELCYGSGTQEVATRIDDAPPYGEVGDVIETGVVFVVATATTAESPSLALMRPRANFVDDTLTMVLVGNVSLENLGNERSDFVAVDISVSRRNGAQIFTQPNEPTEDYLCWGCVVRAVGRSADGVWVAVLREDDSMAWVSPADMEADFDVAFLPIMEADAVIDPPYLGSMQALTLVSGMNDAPCAGAPESGLIVQSPDLEREAYLIVNGLDIYFTGTLFLQAEPSTEMIVSVLEGSTLLGTGDDAFTLNVGERLRYPFDGQTVGEHTTFESYHYAAARQLPSLYLLQRGFELPFSTGGLITPYIDGVLASVTADNPCTIAWTVDVNLRAGPGTDFPIRQGVAANYVAYPDARASGTDGLLWWRLADEIWLNAENTIAAGACGTLPVLTVETP